MDTARLAAEFPSDISFLIRTDFDDEDAWRAVAAAVTGVPFPRAEPEPEDPRFYDPGDDPYEPKIEVIDDPGNEGLTAAELAEQFTPTPEVGGYVILADSRSMTEVRDGGELTVIYVDLNATGPDIDEGLSYPGRSFRTVVGEVANIEVNLSISNLHFDDFASRVDPDGVFRDIDAPRRNHT